MFAHARTSLYDLMIRPGQLQRERTRTQSLRLLTGQGEASPPPSAAPPFAFFRTERTFEDSSFRAGELARPGRGRRDGGEAVAVGGVGCDEAAGSQKMRPRYRHVLHLGRTNAPSSPSERGEVSERRAHGFRPQLWAAPEPKLAHHRCVHGLRRPLGAHPAVRRGWKVSHSVALEPLPAHAAGC